MRQDVRNICKLELQEDYFDAASGVWDMDGLQDDLRLAKVLWEDRAFFCLTVLLRACVLYFRK